jgi:hypothetical protein
MLSLVPAIFLTSYSSDHISSLQKYVPLLSITSQTSPFGRCSRGARRLWNFAACETVASDTLWASMPLRNKCSVMLAGRLKKCWKGPDDSHDLGMTVSPSSCILSMPLALRPGQTIVGTGVSSSPLPLPRLPPNARLEDINILVATARGRGINPQWTNIIPASAANEVP